MFSKIQYPLCDKCGKEIRSFGIHIVEKGMILYVHESYDKETGLCKGY